MPNYHCGLDRQARRRRHSNRPDIRSLSPGWPYRPFVLDGEAVVFDEQIVSRYHLLMNAEPDRGRTGGRS